MYELFTVPIANCTMNAYSNVLLHFNLLFSLVKSGLLAIFKQCVYAWHLGYALNAMRKLENFYFIESEMHSRHSDPFEYCKRKKGVHSPFQLWNAFANFPASMHCWTHKEKFLSSFPLKRITVFSEKGFPLLNIINTFCPFVNEARRKRRERRKIVSF